MIFARKVLLVVVGCLGTSSLRAQSAFCVNSSKLICLLPVATRAVLPSGASEIATATTTSEALAFNGPIGVQLSQLPAATSASGAVTFIVKKPQVDLNGNPKLDSNGNPLFESEPLKDYNLGPILLDRPNSVGSGNLALGFSAQSFNFYKLDGVGIGNLPLAYPVVFTSGQQYASEYVAQTAKISLHFNQYIAVASYGLPKKTDVSVVVPFSHISISAASSNPIAYLINSDNQLQGVFQETGATSTQSGSASGIGDVSVSVKHVLWSGGESRKAGLAIGTALRFPTGDAENYLGSGAYGVNVFALASYRAKWSPHVKVAHQWNTGTILLNQGLVTGTASTNPTLPGGAQYAVGFDARLHPRLTWSEDIIANQFTNSPYFTKSTQVIPASTSNTGTTQAACPTTNSSAALPPCSLTSIVPGTSTYTSVNLSAGLKWKPFKNADLILYGNSLLQVNNVGLLSHVSPSGGISYSFATYKPR